MSGEKVILKTENVTMQFGGVVAVNNLNMEVKEGEIVAIIGPNGAGKTTAFNVITGVYAPTNGRVYFDGELVVENYPHGKMKAQYQGENAGLYNHSKEPTPDALTALGMARTFQNIRLWKSMTVFDNVLVAKHLKRTSNIFSAAFRANSAEEARQRDEVDELLKVVGLYEERDELATSLPYGKQRRLEIARALASSPKLLLLDEPAAGMNPQETLDLAKFIHQIRDDFHVTILLIEHHMDLVMDISERIYVLDFGRQIAHGTPEEIQKNEKVIEAYLGVSEEEEAEGTAEAEQKVSEKAADAVAAEQKAGEKAADSVEKEATSEADSNDDGKKGSLSKGGE